MRETANRYSEYAALLKAGTDGDATSYRRFLEGIAPLIRAFVARRIAGSDIEDVVQEVLISVHKARHTYDGERPLLPWLQAIIRFRVNDHLRKVYRSSQNETQNIDDYADIIPDVTFSASGNESIDELLEGTSNREKQILKMVHVEGLTAKETGRQLGMSESAVKVATHRAIKKLRETLLPR